jgi:hypothetical protein
MGGSPHRAVHRAALRRAERVWRDLRFKDLYRSGKEFELMHRALSFAGVAFAGSVQAGFERIWGLPAGPWHKIWRQAVWAVGFIAYICWPAGLLRPRLRAAHRQ